MALDFGESNWSGISKKNKLKNTNWYAIKKSTQKILKAKL